MIICSIILYVFFILFGWKKNKFLFNPLSIFSLIWLFVLICSVTHNKLNFPQNETLYMMFYGTLSYGFGTILADKTKCFKITYKGIVLSNKEEYYKPRYKLIVVLCVVCIIAYSYNLITIVSATGTLSSGAIKSYLQTYSYSRSSWINALYFIIVDPLTVAIPICSISDYIFGNRNKVIFILSILLIFLKTITNATRSTLGIFVLYFVIGGLMYIKINGNDKKIRSFLKRIRKRILAASIMAILVFIYMTVSRGFNVFENLWTDFALPTNLFEYWKNKVDDKEIIGYGLASFNGFIYPVFYIIKNIFNVQIPVYIQNINNIVSDTDLFVYASNRVLANAYVSIYWYFYLDFRYIGIILGMFLVGCLVMKKYIKVLKNVNCRNFSLYCFYFQIIIYSIVRMPFTIVSSALGFLYVAFLLYENKEQNYIEVEKNV